MGEAEREEMSGKGEMIHVRRDKEGWRGNMERVKRKSEKKQRDG